MFRPICSSGKLSTGTAGLLFFLGLATSFLAAQTVEDNPTLGQHLYQLSAAWAPWMHLQSAGQTSNHNDLWRVELGAGTEEQRRRRPALILVAGIEGDDLAGTACAVYWIENLLTNALTMDSGKRLLTNNTIYVFPRLNPDAADLFFHTPRQETSINLRPGDDDGDGLVDEDGPEDLNGDGMISWMRIQDPEGEYILDSREPRLLMKADKARGETGQWRLLLEGRDNDGDETWNEDPKGGINFNRNFPFRFEYFARGSGVHPISEPETRCLADFVIDHPNIGVGFVFGAGINLLQPPEAETGDPAVSRPGGPNRPIAMKPPAKIHKDDLPYYRELGKSWRDTLGIKRELKNESLSGTFADWLYFHRGRLALAGRAWDPTIQSELAKLNAPTPQSAKDKKDIPAPGTGNNAEKGGSSEPDKDDKGSDDKRNEEARVFLRWLDTNAPTHFLPWQGFAHPDFPGKKAEIGGFAPFARVLPPEPVLRGICEKQARFLSDLATKLPHLHVRQVKVKRLDNEVDDILLQLENLGYLPTALAHGSQTRQVQPIRVVLDVPDSTILAGSRITFVETLEGSGGMKEIHWVIRARQRQALNVRIVSVSAGQIEQTIELKEANR